MFVLLIKHRVARKSFMATLFHYVTKKISCRILEAVLICLFEGLRVKNFRFDRFFQGR